MMPRGLAIPLLATLILLPPLAAAGPPSAASPSPPSGIFAESVDVQVVNVEVYVTDRDGKPVEGLQREDFALREDGKPVTLSNFYAVGGSGAAGGDLPRPSPTRSISTSPSSSTSAA